MKKISRRSFLQASAVSAVAVSLAACGQSVVDTTSTSTSTATSSDDTATDVAADVMKIGYVYIGDDSEAYTANFIAAEEAVKAAYGDEVTTIAKYNVAEDAVEDPTRELCEAGCSIIFTTSYGYGEVVKELAVEYPDIHFSHATGDSATASGISNYTNAMGAVYEARYVAGIVSGMKLAEELAAGTISYAKIGYVGAYPYAEVISGYTAFFLGVRSIVADATMEVMYANTWGDFDTEKTMATALIENGCNFISQHSDTEGPAEACENAMNAGNPVYCACYNQDMTDVAPNTCLLSSRIDWSAYQVELVSQIMNGETPALDVWAGFDEAWVALTPLNTAIAAEGTQDAIDAAIAGFVADEIDVFVGDYTGTNPWDDTDVIDLSAGFVENESQSAPAFSYVLDDVITVLSTN
ncbi:MAG: BMP family ABC transporter substrate-binding protein [Faecalibacterium sp.]